MTPEKDCASADPWPSRPAAPSSGAPQAGSTTRCAHSHDVLPLFGIEIVARLGDALKRHEPLLVAGTGINVRREESIAVEPRPHVERVATDQTDLRAHTDVLGAGERVEPCTVTNRMARMPSNRFARATFCRRNSNGCASIVSGRTLPA